MNRKTRGRKIESNTYAHSKLFKNILIFWWLQLKLYTWQCSVYWMLMSHHNWTKSDQNKTKHSHNNKFGYWICGHRSTGIDLLLAAISFSRLWTHSSNLANLLDSPNVNQIKLNLWYRNQSEENRKSSLFYFKMHKITNSIPLQLSSFAERHCFLLLSLREQSLFFFFLLLRRRSITHSFFDPIPTVEKNKKNHFSSVLLYFRLTLLCIVRVWCASKATVTCDGWE